jgi:hypothetical protein
MSRKTAISTSWRFDVCVIPLTPTTEFRDTLLYHYVRAQNHPPYPIQTLHIFSRYRVIVAYKPVAGQRPRDKHVPKATSELQQ